MQSVLTSAAAEGPDAVVVAVAVAAFVAVEWVAAASQASVAVASDSAVVWAGSDEVEAWSCVLVRVSWYALAGSEGTNLAAWGLRTEGDCLRGQHCPHSRAPWSLQEPQRLVQRGQIEL